jgi:hypothetical protein
MNRFARRPGLDPEAEALISTRAGDWPILSNPHRSGEASNSFQSHSFLTLEVIISFVFYLPQKMPMLGTFIRLSRDNLHN